MLSIGPHTLFRTPNIIIPYLSFIKFKFEKRKIVWTTQTTLRKIKGLKSIFSEF